MATCGDSEYEMIEYSDLFDLRDGKLVRAQINTINGADNTADITILDECDALSGQDLTSVPFFYHCENSKGTIEDLQQGYMAFSPYDLVYAIFIPASGDVLQRFYIIGHADIRGTNSCKPEYLLVVYRSFMTVINAKTGLELDLQNFVPLDSSSPEAPSELPCKLSYLSWFSYNFRNSVPKVTVPYTATPYQLSSSEVQNGWSTSSGTCIYERVVTQYSTFPDLEGKIRSETSLRTYSDPESANCVLFYGLDGYMETVDATDPNEYGTIITDSVTNAQISVRKNSRAETRTDFSINGRQGASHFNAVLHKHVTFSVDMVGIGSLPTFIIDIDSDASMQSQNMWNWYVPGKNTTLGIDYQTVANAAIREGELNTLQFYDHGILTCIGEDGVYSFLPFERNDEGSQRADDISMNSISGDLYPIPKTLEDALYIRGGRNEFDPDYPLQTYRLNLALYPRAIPTSINDVYITLQNTVSIADCFSNADMIVGSNMNTSISKLAESEVAMFVQNGWQNITGWVCPTVTVHKKK